MIPFYRAISKCLEQSLAHSECPIMVVITILLSTCHLDHPTELPYNPRASKSKLHFTEETGEVQKG